MIGFNNLTKNIIKKYKLKKVKYLGKVNYGAPYFYPRNYVSFGIHIEFVKEKHIYVNRSWKTFTINLFGNKISIDLGTPIKIVKVPLGWKDKFDSPRFEWAPQFHLFFFNIQYMDRWLPNIVK